MSNNEIIDTPATEVVYDPEKIYATIVLRDDGFHVIDEDGTEGPVCKFSDEGKTIVLTKNASNRQWFNVAKAEAEIAEKGHVDLYYKATKKLGAVSRNTLPNAKLISYLSEEDQAEYKAIIDRAIAAREADRKKPMTELEKARARVEKYKAALAKLEAENADLID